MKRTITLLILLLLIGVQSTFALQSPEWLEPGENDQEVDPYDFHIQLFEVSHPQGHAHISSDFEIWDVTLDQIVWEAKNTDILLHIHNADGQFLNDRVSDDRLRQDTTYYVRARYQYSNGDYSNWSTNRNFKTKPFQTYEDTGKNWTLAEGYEIEEIASGLSMPTQIAIAPNIHQHLPFDKRPRLYVTQLYGRVSVILNDGTVLVYADNLLNFNPSENLPGAGEVGTVGIHADNDGTIFITTAYKGPAWYDASIEKLYGKVIKFTSNNDGTTYIDEEIIIDGIPSDSSHQIHSIIRGPDNYLYITVGDAGQLENSRKTNILSGKVLRINDDGTIPSDNPYGNAVYASGFRNAFGATFTDKNELVITHNGPDKNDGIFFVEKSDNNWWCLNSTEAQTYNVENRLVGNYVCDTSYGTWHVWEKPVAPVGIAVDLGNSRFPHNSEGSIYAALSGPTYHSGPDVRGKRIVQFTRFTDGSKDSINTIAVYTGSGKGTPIGLAFGTDGLYFTDIYGDIGFTGQYTTQGKIYLIKYTGSTHEHENETMPPEQPTPEQPPTNDTSNQFFTVSEGFPNGLAVQFECDYTENEELVYSYIFGETDAKGTPIVWTDKNKKTQYYTYAEYGTYNVTCSIISDWGGETLAEENIIITLSEEGSEIIYPEPESPAESVEVQIRISNNYPQQNGAEYRFECSPSDLSYSWSVNGNNTTPSSSSFTYTFQNSGEYNVECFNSNTNKANMNVSVQISTPQVSNPPRSSGGGGGSSGGGSITVPTQNNTVNTTEETNITNSTVNGNNAIVQLQVENNTENTTDLSGSEFIQEIEQSQETASGTQTEEQLEQVTEEGNALTGFAVSNEPRRLNPGVTATFIIALIIASSLLYVNYTRKND